MAQASPPPLSLKSIQGEIYPGFPKKAETYLFFRINDQKVNDFRKNLKDVIPLISSGADVLNARKKIAEYKKQEANKGKLFKQVGVNIAFSQKGLVQLGFDVAAKDKLNDTPFEGGMTNDASLNDSPDKWFLEFKQDIHGLITVAGDSQVTVDEKLKSVLDLLKDTILQVKRADGHVRPGKESGHEHFGYLDGVSQPAVLGLDNDTFKGQELIRQGIILLGREGDAQSTGFPVARPDWALDGSFLTFRYLSQLVPEFQGFVDEQNPVGAPKDLIGARLVGRWKSGAPIDISPLKDNSALGADVHRNDDFRYDPFSQDRCPFAAHTRKTNPRSDLPAVETHRILRRGIQFGPEVTEEEKTAGTKLDRGLLFKSFSSNNVAGFQFIQKNWANNASFPFLFSPGNFKPGFDAQRGPGFDAIVGQAPGGGQRAITLDANSSAGTLNLPVEWVVTRGGEYFFTPSISALKARFALGGESERGELRDT